jgi:AraC family cel operon transcriptional repressor
MPRSRRLPLPAGLGQQFALTVARLRFRPGSTYDRHHHDFAEVFWIEEGRCRHLIGDREEECPAGTLLFIRPHDVHAFATFPGEEFILVNITFPAAVPTELARRWRKSLPAWPWDAGAQPCRWHLAGHHLERLGAWADTLMADNSRLALEAFLLDVLRIGAHRDGTPPGKSRENSPASPPWLTRALGEFTDPARIGSGLTGFIRCCRRSVAHVNRVVQQCHGCTTTVLISRLRLDHACRRLRLSDEAIPAIAADAGYASLAHFYRAFAKHQHCTPRHYREQHRRRITSDWR